MPETVSKGTAKLLKDITGEPRLELAVRATMEDALLHRLEGVEEGLEELRDRYGMSFDEFEEAWERGDIEDRHSYDVEKDYWRWDELTTRKKRIRDALDTL